MFKNIEKLKLLGYVPDAILDIGAHHGNWTKSIKCIYPNSKYFLFEGIPYDQLDIYKNTENCHVFCELLNDRIDEVDWYQEKNTGDSFFREKSKHFKNTIPIKRKTTTLDEIVSNNEILQTHENIFIKIDCQGAEISILKGSKKLWSKTNFVLLEIPLFGQYNEGVPTFLEHIQFMQNIGFIPYDILESHYINNFNMQIDMLFINKSHMFNKIVQEKLL
tara:strand:- start:1007 stop:1663 length:657 start_codon:yes stop_codon:yes gene_type:complete